jgi:flagellar secretion chaperone FliS
MSQQGQYLESKILTAPPHRLHLMLIEGAIRFGRQAEKELEAANNVAAMSTLTRVLDIVGEMLAGIRQNKSEVNDKLAAVYWFIFRRVSEATLESDKTALAEVLRLLEFERETWQKVCEKLGAAGNAPATVPPPAHAMNAAHSATTSAGISLQA